MSRIPLLLHATIAYSYAAFLVVMSCSLVYLFSPYFFVLLFLVCLACVACAVVLRTLFLFMLGASCRKCKIYIKARKKMHFIVTFGLRMPYGVRHSGNGKCGASNT